MAPLFAITAFYKFFPIGKDELQPLQSFLQAEGDKLDMCGLLLIAPEGMNATVAGSPDAVAAFKKVIEAKAGSVIFKNSTTDTKPFKRYKAKIREEIVSIGDTSNVPRDSLTHVTPDEWDAMLQNEDVLVIDTRNDYETAIGMFEKAVDPKLKTFQEFPEYVRNADIPKDKKVMIYCTGGIRCEKAAVELKRQGYNNVYQLSGGILKYLEEKAKSKFHGECFVFDHRVAVDEKLEPSKKYKLCPHCGDPGDETIVCGECKQSAIICKDCSRTPTLRTCSKNCAYHHEKHLDSSLAHA
ncbi:MAG: hypothetical protein KBD00_00170 [Candidatus Peribacteraceae bacterium]|nr:hypothetical protein [Candidatus Peribacteraceae bacterium]